MEKQKWKKMRKKEKWNNSKSWWAQPQLNAVVTIITTNPNYCLLQCVPQICTHSRKGTYLGRENVTPTKHIGGNVLNLSLASDKNGRTQWSRCLGHGFTWLASRDYGFEFHRGHGCMSHWVLCIVSVSGWSLAVRSPTVAPTCWILCLLCSKHVAINFLATRHTNRM